MNSWLISWRSLTRRKLRTLFTFAAIAIGVGATLAVTSTVETTQQRVDDYLESFNEKAHMRVRSTEQTFSAAVMDDIRHIPEVSGSLAHLVQPAKLDVASIPSRPNVPDPNAKVVLHGYSDPGSRILGWQVIEGDLQGQGLIVTDAAAQLWGVKAGDAISLQVADKKQTALIAAIVSSNDILHTPSGWQGSLVSRWHAAVPLELLQSWSGQAAQVQEIHIRVLDGRAAEAAAQLESLLKAYPQTYLDPSIMSENDLMYGFQDIISALYMLGLLGLIMSSAILFGSMYVSVVERRREFAVMKTLGLTTGQIAKILLREVVLLGLLGTAAGLVLGTGLAFGMTYGLMEMLNDINDPAASGLALSWQAIILSIAAGVGGSLLAALWPMIDAMRTSVAYVLRETAEERESGGGWIAAAAGAVLASIGLWMSSPLRVLPLFIGLLLLFPLIMKGMQLLLSPVLRMLLGFEGTVASTSVARQLRRTSMTAAILCIGLSFLLTIGSIRTSMEQSVERTSRQMVGGDLVVSTSTPITAEDVRKVREAEGVIGAALMREASVVWQGEKEPRKLLMIGAHEPSSDAVPSFASAKESAHAIMEKLKEPHTVALGDAVFKAWNGQIGDSITLKTPSGEQALKVVAVVNTLRENGNAVFVSDDRISGEFGIRDGKKLALLVRAGTPVETVERQMEAQFAERLSGLRSVDDYLANRKEDLLIPFAMMNVLIGLIVVISGVGILNTLMMNVTERTREFGTMRAIASTRWQMRKIVLGEGLIIGAAAAVIGVALGLSLSYSIADGNVIAGLPVSVQISWGQVGLAAGFGIVVALGSAWLPAVVASRVPVSQAMRYE